MSKNLLNYDEIRDQHLDTMLKLAFKHADALEAQDIMEESDTAECPVSEERAEATYKMFLDKLAKQEGEEKRNARIVQLRRSIPRIIQIAACLVLVMGIVTPFAVANVESIRVKVMELLISIQEDHTELSFVENESAAFDVPADWQGTYYPAYIPEEFSLVELGRINSYLRYENEQGTYIDFTEYSADDSVDINSENAELSYTTIHGTNAFVIEREDGIIVTWGMEDKFFVLISNTTKDATLEIAQNVQRISIK